MRDMHVSGQIQTSWWRKLRDYEVKMWKIAMQLSIDYLKSRYRSQVNFLSYSIGLLYQKLITVGEDAAALFGAVIRCLQSGVFSFLYVSQCLSKLGFLSRIIVSRKIKWKKSFSFDEQRSENFIRCFQSDVVVPRRISGVFKSVLFVRVLSPPLPPFLKVGNSLRDLTREFFIWRPPIEDTNKAFPVGGQSTGKVV